MSSINRAYFVLFIGVLKDVKLVGGGIKCDDTKSIKVNAGELGLHAAFPWLGLLRVHLYETKNTALSGVVLVRDRYAIGNAEDITRIPRRIFRRDADVFFIPSVGETWVCRLLDYITHPEYDSHISTIALVELDLVGRGRVPFSAVCWPQGSTNPHELYAIGYSDASDDIEFGKMILKLKNEYKTTCDAFYDNVGSTAHGFQLEQFLCGVAVDPTEDCNWETGMAMVSNATGVWTLIGLSVQGPSCDKPARFLEFFPYLEWIQSAIDPNSRDLRRSGHGLGFKKTKKQEKQDIFIHETSDLKPGRRQGDPRVDAQVLEDLELSVYPYPFRDPESHFNFKVDRIDRDAINISVFDHSYEVNGGCHRAKYLMYQDRIKVVAKRDAGTAAYRLTLYDMLLNNLTCVQVYAKSKARTPVTLWWMTYLDKGEGTAFGPYPETPEALLKIIPQKRLHPPATEGDGRWIPKDHLEPRPLEDPNDTLNIININLLVKLFFAREAQLNVRVYGIPKYIPTTTTTTTTEAVTTATQNISDIANRLYQSFNFQHANIFETLNLPRRRREDTQKDRQYNGDSPESYTSEHPELQLQRGHVKKDQDSEEEGDPMQQFNDLHHIEPPLPQRTAKKYGEYIPESHLSRPRIMLWPESYRDEDQDNVGYKQKTHKRKHQSKIFKDTHYSNTSLRHWSTEKDHYSKGDYRPEPGLPKYQFNTNSEKDYDSKEGIMNETHKPKYRFTTFNSPHDSDLTLHHWSAEKDRDFDPGEIDKKEKYPQHSLIWPKGRHNPKSNILQNSYGRRLRSRRRQDLDGIPHQKPAQDQNVGRGHHHRKTLTQKPQTAYEIEKNKGSKENSLILRLEDY